MTESRYSVIIVGGGIVGLAVRSKSRGDFLACASFARERDHVAVIRAATTAASSIPASITNPVP